jgi:Zn-dependent peptidase ImmA (M78 family)
MAIGLRDIFISMGMPDQPFMPVMDLVEGILENEKNAFRIEAVSHREMGSAEGATCQTGKVIMLRDDVLLAACRDEPRARFTVIHELAHWFLHTGEDAPLARMMPNSNLPLYRQSEWQANQFAGALLMPAKYFDASDLVNIEGVMKRHGVSHGAAQIRLGTLRKQGVI